MKLYSKSVFFTNSFSETALLYQYSDTPQVSAEILLQNDVFCGSPASKSFVSLSDCHAILIWALRIVFITPLLRHWTQKVICIDLFCISFVVRVCLDE